MCEMRENMYCAKISTFTVYRSSFRRVVRLTQLNLMLVSGAGPLSLDKGSQHVLGSTYILLVILLLILIQYVYQT